MPMKVEAAIVTQKRPEAAYNTDSVNVNGKVMPREVIKNGYKGSGVLGSSVYFALTSSAVEGFADATVTAFNQRAELFSRSRDSMSVFSGFFEDCRGALIGMKRSADELVSAGFYATGRKAVLAFNGNAKIYLQRLGILTPVNGEKVIDTTADFRGAVFNDACVGDIFILLSPGAAEVLTDKDIEDILKISDGSVKKVVNYILKAALSKNSDKAVSAIVIKVLETALDEEIVTPAFVPDFSEEEKASEEAVTESADVASVTEEVPAEGDDIAAVFSKNAHEMFEDVNSGEETEPVDAEEAADEEITASEVEALYVEAISTPDEEPDASDEEIAEDAEKLSEEADALIAAAEVAEKSAADKKKTLLLFLGGVLIAFALAALVAFVIVPAFSGEEEGTTEEETTIEETTDEQTTEEESSEAETTEEETTEKAEEKTTKKEETTTKRRPAVVSTTAASATAPAVTTTKPQETTREETTSEQEATTAEETTEAEEATTAEQEATTAAQETTESEATTEEETEAEETSTKAVPDEEESSSDEAASAEEAVSDNGTEEETQAQ